MGVLSDLIEAKFGVKTRANENPLVAAVGAASIPIALAHPDRVALIFINLSANLVYIRPSPGAAAATGIVLAANGGWRSFVWDEDWELVGSLWHGIAPAGASAIYVLEMIGEGKRP
jgi:hypothetical protein